MTAEHVDDDEVRRRLVEVLETQASTIPVGDAWGAIASRLLVEPDRSEDGQDSPSARGRPRRVLRVAAAGVGLAAAVLLVVVLGWRPATVAPRPAALATTTVPRYDAAIPTLVVYRAAPVEHASSDAPPSKAFTITPERMRTDAPDVGVAALDALLHTPPVQPGARPPGEQKIGRGEIGSVRVSGGLIRVELDSFFSPLYPEAEAHVIAQTWVRTLQDTLDANDDVVITLRGRPFKLYGVIDTAEPLTRDGSLRVVRPDGFDSPRNGDVVPSTFVLLASVTVAPGRPGRVEVIDLDTGRTAYEQDLVVASGRAAPIDVQPVLTLSPGRYRATLTGHGVPGVRDVNFTVVP